jgi:hypothetical protein
MVVGVAELCVQFRQRDLGGSILPLALHVLFRLRHHQGENDHQHVVFATSQDLFDNRVSKNIELENVIIFISLQARRSTNTAFV